MGQIHTHGINLVSQRGESNELNQTLYGGLMSHFKFSLAVLPLLSILAMSPSDIEKKFPSRSLASDIEAAAPAKASELAQKPFPLLREYVRNVDPKKVDPIEFPDQASISARLISEKRDILKDHDDFKKDEASQEDLESLKVKISGYVNTLIVSEKALKELKAKDLSSHSDDGASSALLVEVKAGIENLLKDVADRSLALNPESDVEVAVASEESAVAPEEKEVKAQPEVKVVAPVVVDGKQPEAKPEKDPVLCALEEQNKILTAQNQTLMSFMSPLLNLLLQRQDNMRSQSLYPSHNAFQYSQTQNIGNWGYQNPEQSFLGTSMFSNQPQVPQLQAQPQIQPQQQPSINPNWTSIAAIDPRYSAANLETMRPAEFGINSFGFDMSSPLQQPALLQAPSMLALSSPAMQVSAQPMRFIGPMI